MMRLMRERAGIGVVADQVGTPTYARDLAETIALIISKASPVYGVYHFTNGGSTNWHEFAIAIRDESRDAGILSGDCAVTPLTSDQYPTKVRRPSFSVLSKDKIERDYGIKPRGWREGLRAFIGEIRDDGERLRAFTKSK